MHLFLLLIAQSKAREFKWQKEHTSAIWYQTAVIAPDTAFTGYGSSGTEIYTPYLSAQRCQESSVISYAMVDYIFQTTTTISPLRKRYRKMRGIGMCNTKQTHREEWVSWRRKRRTDFTAYKIKSTCYKLAWPTWCIYFFFPPNRPEVRKPFLSWRTLGWSPFKLFQSQSPMKRG